jgi:hypothetical protein
MIVEKTRRPVGDKECGGSLHHCERSQIFEGAILSEWKRAETAERENKRMGSSTGKV